MKKNLSIIFAIAILSACAGKEDAEIAVTGFSLSESSVEVRLESTHQLKAVITPENATNQEVTWKSYNPEIATVDANGLVKGVAIGNATIAATCTSSGAMRQCAVSVIPKFDYVDLGAAETANCYIIPEAGHYKFEAVKGNSFESVGKVDHAAVLWETYGTTDEIVAGAIINPEITILNNYIIFDTADPFSTGNAVIAAYDNADNILWSWHIWVPSGKIAEKHYVSGAGITMDRNLGATTATPGLGTTNGFIYQWGRKDPFPGAPDVDKTNSLQTATTLEAWPDQVDYIAANADKCTIEYTISHPTTRLAKLTSTFANNDWLYTGTAEADATRWVVDSKTMYDPCPPGWRVPNRQGGVDPMFATIENGTAIDGNTGLSFDSTNGCLVVGTSFCEDGPDYYPLVLFTNNGVTAVEKTAVTGVIYWSSFSQSAGNVMGSNWQITGSKFYPKGTANKMYYAPIRCCKVDTLE